MARASPTIAGKSAVAPAPGTLSYFAVEIVPSVFNKLETGLQPHCGGEITDFRNLFFNLNQRLDDFLQPLFNAKEAVDPLLHHRIDGEFQTLFGFWAQRIDAPLHPVLKPDKFAL